MSRSTTTTVKTRTIAQIPLVTFNAPDQLQRQNGQAFTGTLTSGTPLAEAAGSNGAGNLVTSSMKAPTSISPFNCRN